MNLLQLLTFAQCLAPIGKDNGNYDGNAAVDTQGLHELAFLIAAGALAADIGSTGEDAALKIEECDTVNGIYTDVTDAALAAPIAAADQNGLRMIVVDLKKTHKRFMRVNAPHSGDGSGTASLLSIVAIGVPDAQPLDAAGAGLDELILP